MKILQVSHDLNIGGLQRVVLDLSFGLAALGHEVHICSLRGNGPLEGEIRDRKLPLHVMPWPEHGADRLLFLKLLRLMRAQGYDVVHTHNTHAFIDGGIAAMLAGVPVRVHTDHARAFPDKRRYMLAERLLSLGYGRVVAVSRRTAEDLRRHEGIAANRISVIENGIDGAAYRRSMERTDRAGARRELGLGDMAPVLGLGARLEPVKGIEHLLAAMPRILERNPGAGLLLAGRGSQEEYLRRRAVELGIDGAVRFLGDLPRLTEFYPLLDIYVLPSLSEGLPLGLLEAMSVGLPVVASRVGGVEALLAHGRNALLVDPGRPEQIAEGVLHLCAHPEAARELGRKGQGLFEERYDRAVMIEAYLSLYRELDAAAGRRRRRGRPAPRDETAGAVPGRGGNT